MVRAVKKNMNRDNQDLRSFVTALKEKDGGFDTILYQMSRGRGITEEEIKANLDTRIVEFLLDMPRTEVELPRFGGQI